MTPDKQRYVIATTFGAVITTFPDGTEVVTMDPNAERDTYIKPLSEPAPEYVFSTSVPDYLNSLSACRLLIDRLAPAWSCVLVAENGRRACTFVRKINTSLEFKVIASRFEDAICEAYLKVRGLWEAEPKPSPWRVGEARAYLKTPMFEIGLIHDPAADEWSVWQPTILSAACPGNHKTLEAAQTIAVDTMSRLLRETLALVEAGRP